MVPVTATATAAILLGVPLALGLYSVAMVLTRLSRPRLADRVAPYLMDVSEAAREHAERVGSRSVAWTRVLPARLASSLAAPGWAANRLQERLDQAGSGLRAESFRARRLAAAALAGAITGAVLAAVAARANLPVAVAAALPATVAVTVYAAFDWRLGRRIAARRLRVAEEFPTVVELLALSLSAGEGLVDALRRVARTGSGALSAELGSVVREVAIGVPLAESLNKAARTLGVPAFTRACAAISTALDRGTPLAEALRAQASDAREDAKRRLMEVAGRKEIAMLVPLVFLILPVTVLLAVWPGVFVLQAGF